MSTLADRVRTFLAERRAILARVEADAATEGLAMAHAIALGRLEAACHGLEGALAAEEAMRETLERLGIGMEEEAW
jgi:hypothetical protein